LHNLWSSVGGCCRKRMSFYESQPKRGAWHLLRILCAP